MYCQNQVQRLSNRMVQKLSLRPHHAQYVPLGMLAARRSE
jgi:hypothetical protein